MASAHEAMRGGRILCEWMNIAGRRAEVVAEAVACLCLAEAGHIEAMMPALRLMAGGEGFSPICVAPPYAGDLAFQDDDQGPSKASLMADVARLKGELVGVRYAADQDPVMRRLRIEVRSLKGRLVDARRAQETAEALLAGVEDGASTTTLFLNSADRFVCPDCDTYFKQPGALRKHLRKAHADVVTIGVLLHRQSATGQAGAASGVQKVEGG